MLAVVYSLETFHQCTYGRCVCVQSDRKPLVNSHLATAQCSETTSRCHPSLQKYGMQISYRKGKEVKLMDTCIIL